MRGGEASQESGGNYRVRPNARTGAAGKYQVLPSNIPSWTQKHYHQPLTPEQFQANPKAQEAVFNGEMSDYLRRAKRANPRADDTTIKRMAAAAWYGGPGRMHRYDDPTVFRPGEPSFRDYTNGVVNGGSHRQSNHQVDDPFKAAANAYQPTPVDDPFKAAAQAYTPAAPPSPVPESPDTIAIQKQAAMNPNVMARSAVLTTDPSQDHLFENDPNFQKVTAPEGVQGTLWVNTQKAAKLKLRTPEEIQHYVAVNPAAMMRLIGKPVAPVDDTSQGVSVHTTVPHPQTGQPVEASTTVVTNEKDAMKQREADQASFGPGAVTTVIPTSQAVQNRLVGQGVDPASLAPLADDLGNSLPLPAGVDPNAPAPAMSPTSAQAKQPVGKSVAKAPEPNKAVGQHGERTDVTIGDENYDEQGNLLDKNLQPTPPRPASQVNPRDWDSFKGAVSDTIPLPENIKNKADAEKYLGGRLQAKYPGIHLDDFHLVTDFKPGQNIDVTYGDLARGGVDVNPLLDQKTIEARQQRSDNPSQVNLGGDVPRDYGMEFAQEDAKDVNDFAAAHPELADAIVPGLSKVVDSKSVAGVPGAFVASIGDLAGMVGGIIDKANEYSPTMNATREILSNGGSRKVRLLDPTVENARRFFEVANAFGNATGAKSADGSDTLPTVVFKGIGQAPKMAILSAVPGGMVVGFALEGAGIKQLEGGSGKDVTMAALKGGAQGALFHFLPKGIGKLFGEETEGLVNVAKQGTELGSMVGGNFAIGAAFGDDPHSNLINSLALGVFHLSGLAPKVFAGKTFHGVDPESGAEVYAKVEGDKLVAAEPTDDAYQMVLNRDQRRASATVPETEAEPEKTKYTSVLDEIRQRGLDTTAKVKEAFPHLSRQEAADYHRQAFPEGAKSTEEAPRTVTHPDPEINGKEVVAETADGRVVVPNDTNASGVSVVKDRATTGGVLEPPVETPSDFEQLPREQKEEVIRQSGKDVEEKDAQKPVIEQPEAPKPAISLKDVVNKRGKQIFADEEAAQAAHAKESLKDHGETYDEYLKRKLCSEGPVAAYSNKGKKKSRK